MMKNWMVRLGVLALIFGAFVLTGCATCGGGSCGADVQTIAPLDPDDHHHVTTLRLQKHIEDGTATLVDARFGTKHDDGTRIPGAKSLSSNPTDEEVLAVLPNKDALVITYCGNPKCPLSERLTEKLESLGYTHVHEYEAGIAGWKAAGGHVE